MLKKSALKKAVDAGWTACDSDGDSQLRESLSEDQWSGIDTLVDTTADRAYDLGRLVGLQEASGITKSKEFNYFQTLAAIRARAKNFAEELKEQWKC